MIKTIKHINNNNICYFIIFIVFYAVSINTAIIENEYFYVHVNQMTGQFYIKTENGDINNPYDNRKDILYSPKTKSWSSYTTLRVDGEELRFGSKKGHMITSPKLYGDTLIYTVWEYKSIEVEQIIEFVKSKVTNRDDMIKIEYRLSNSDLTIHSTGLRVMMDLRINNRDENVIRDSFGRLYVRPTTIEKERLTDYWILYDRLPKPTGKFILMFDDDGSRKIKPDKILFTSWKDLYDDPWLPDKTINTFVGNPDNAIALMWNTIVFTPMKRLNYIFNIGVYEKIYNSIECMDMEINYIDPIEAGKICRFEIILKNKLEETFLHDIVLDIKCLDVAKFDIIPKENSIVQIDKIMPGQTVKKFRKFDVSERYFGIAKYEVAVDFMVKNQNIKYKNTYEVIINK